MLGGPCSDADGSSGVNRLYVSGLISEHSGQWLVSVGCSSIRLFVRCTVVCEVLHWLFIYASKRKVN